MHVPFHPLIVHFPLAITFILPILILVFAYMIKVNKMTPHGWLVIVGLQLVVTITGYVALESGENEEPTVEKLVSKEFIHAHEEAAEIFVGSTVILLVISIAAFFIRRDLQFSMKVLVAVLSLVSCFLAYRTGRLGGELVYGHGAGGAYVEDGHDEPMGILPESESIKTDDTDYGDDEEVTPEDENYREED